MGPNGLRCLIVDYGGVLTVPVKDSFDAWIAADDLDAEALKAAMVSLLKGEAPGNVLHGLERGEVTVEEFERELAALLRRTDGSEVAAAGLLTRAFAQLHTSSGMLGVVRRAKEYGLRTGLLSNSWGDNTYERDGWDGLFDAVVISGEVGLRKPEPEIYLLAAERLGVRPEECVFVDDLPVNVRGAAAAGMVGVEHTDLDRTIAELETLFGLELHPGG